ncbi:MAG: hypothetical protein WC220_06935 [Pedobacter sp.]|jgi:hypothetical protein
MNILNILEEIEKTDAEVYERINPGRKVMAEFYGFGKKVALASIPFALGSMFKKAYAQTASADVEAVSQFALTLDYRTGYRYWCDSTEIL